MTKRFWRISNYADLSGFGAKRFASRWNTGGLAMVYLADHPSTALLETIVHFERAVLPSTFQLLAIDAQADLDISDAELPVGWQDRIDSTQRIGQQFLLDNTAPLLRVPSVIMPQAFNYLLNPNHPDVTKLTIVQTWRYPFDSRLLM